MNVTFHNTHIQLETLKPRTRHFRLRSIGGPSSGSRPPGSRPARSPRDWADTARRSTASCAAITFVTATPPAIAGVTSPATMRSRHGRGGSAWRSWLETRSTAISTVKPAEPTSCFDVCLGRVGGAALGTDAARAAIGSRRIGGLNAGLPRFRPVPASGSGANVTTLLERTSRFVTGPLAWPTASARRSNRCRRPCDKL